MAVRRGWAVVAILTLAGLVGVRWLGRDPVPRMLARRVTTLRATLTPLLTDSGHRNERVTLRGANGIGFDLMLRIPTTVTGERRPLFLILGGYRTGDRAATLIPDTRGTIVAALSYPYSGDLKAKGLAVVRQIPAIRRAVFDTPPAVWLALDYLLARADVDTTRVAVVGASFGAPFGAVAAALDSRITQLFVLHGAAAPRAQIEWNLRRRIRWSPARQLASSLANWLVAGDRLDPARWVPSVAPRPVVFINAHDDERMPRWAVDSLHRSARPPSRVVWLDGPHMQSNRKEVLARLVDAVLGIGAPDTPRP